jgi:hypothetical protein
MIEQATELARYVLTHNGIKDGSFGILAISRRQRGRKRFPKQAITLTLNRTILGV